MGPLRDPPPTDVLGARAWLRSAQRVPASRWSLEPTAPPLTPRPVVASPESWRPEVRSVTELAGLRAVTPASKRRLPVITHPSSCQD